MTDTEPLPQPLITIGMPVYNGEKHLRPALDSLLNQTYRNFIIIVSDNASTDRTGVICSEYASSDSRIHYVRQTINIGAEKNFRFVLEQAKSEFFIWAAADDTRSPDFLDLNLSFLLGHSDFIGSTSPVRFSSREFDQTIMGDATLNQENRQDRLIAFFGTWHANARFYSLFRREALMHWKNLDNGFLGSDWTLITYLTSIGKLNRHSEGWLQLGTGGASNTSNIFARYRNRWIDWIFPFNKLTIDTMQYMKGTSPRQQLRVIYYLARLNLQALLAQYKVAKREK